VFILERYSASSDKAAEITTVPILNLASSATMDTPVRIQYFICFVVLCVKGFMCSFQGCILNGIFCT
jgi:hypothetical protein